MEHSTFCLPVTKVGSVYVVDDSARGFGLRDLAPQASLASYFNQNYFEVPGHVFISGQSYDTYVLVPKEDVDDLAYVLVDKDIVPSTTASSTDLEERVDDEERPGAEQVSDTDLSDELQFRLNLVLRECHRTEGLFVPTKMDVAQQFIRPHLRRVAIGPVGIPFAADSDNHLCTVEDVAATPRVVILGAPGAGKTTVMRYLAMQMAWQITAQANEGSIDSSVPFPVYLQLRNPDFLDSVNEAISRFAGNIRRRIAWFLDGLDEVPASQAEGTKKAIVELMRRNRWDAVYLSCRYSAYDGFLKDDSRHFELLPFDSSQMAQWVHQYLDDEEKDEKWLRLMHSLRSVSDLHAVARNPLLLSILCHEYSQSLVMPEQRAQLVRKFVDALCEDWDSTRGVNRAEKGAIPPNVRRVWLSWMAFKAKQRSALCVTLDDLGDLQATHLQRSHDQTIYQVLRRLARDTSLLIEENDRKTFSFVHVLFCDYLAAQHVVAKTEDIVVLMKDIIGSEQWYDVWVLALCLTDDPRHMLEHILATQEITEERKSLLIAGAYAQGVYLPGDLEARCRELVATTFTSLLNSIDGELFFDEGSGSRLSLVIRVEKQASRETLNRSGGVLRQLFMLIHRARWWKHGDSLLRELGEGQGRIVKTVPALLSEQYSTYVRGGGQNHRHGIDADKFFLFELNDRLDDSNEAPSPWTLRRMSPA